MPPPKPLVWPTKDPDEVRTLGLRWGGHLDPGQAIAGCAWVAEPSGLTLANEGFNGTRSHVRVSGGTEGVTYTLTCTVTLTSGDVIPRSGTLTIVER